MTNGKHTPGPWRIGKGGDHTLRIYGRSNKHPICQFGYGTDEEQEILQNAEHNSRLIAAAPVMLELLKEARVMCEDGDGIIDSERLANRIDAVIAKAEGK